MIEQSMKRCHICEEEKVEGIYLLVSFICTDCEKEMLNTAPEDEKYQYYVERLKRGLQNQLNMRLLS